MKRKGSNDAQPEQQDASMTGVVAPWKAAQAQVKKEVKMEQAAEDANAGKRAANKFRLDERAVVIDLDDEDDGRKRNVGEQHLGRAIDVELVEGSADLMEDSNSETEGPANGEENE
jgi:hypothetical protein